MSQYFDEPSPQLREALDQLKIIPPRDPGAAARARSNFLAYAQSQAPSRVVRPRPAFDLWSHLFPKRLSWVVAFLLVVLVIGGGEATVYAAQDSLPNSPLYSVKVFGEDVVVGLSSDPDTKQDLLTGFAVRRVNEIAALAAQGSPIPESVVTRLGQQLDQVMDLEADLPDAELEQTLAAVQATLGEQLQVLAQVQTQVGDPAKPVLARVQQMLQAKYNLVGQGLANPDDFRKRVNDNKPSGTPGQPQRTMTPPGLDRKATVVPSPRPQRTMTPPGKDPAKPATATPGPTKTPPGQGTPPGNPGNQGQGNQGNQGNPPDNSDNKPDSPPGQSNPDPPDNLGNKLDNPAGKSP